MQTENAILESGIAKSVFIPKFTIRKLLATPDKMVSIIEKKSINQKRSEGSLFAFFFSIILLFSIVNSGCNFVNCG